MLLDDTSSIYHSPGFLRLPPEIRIAIYRELLIQRTQFLPMFCSCYSQRERSRKDQGSIHPSILRTCKLVAAEAVPILYRENGFRIRCKIHEPVTTGFNSINRAVGLENLRSVRQVVTAGDMDGLDFMWGWVARKVTSVYTGLEHLRLTLRFPAPVTRSGMNVGFPGTFHLVLDLRLGRPATEGVDEVLKAEFIGYVSRVWVQKHMRDKLWVRLRDALQLGTPLGPMGYGIQAILLSPPPFEMLD